MDTNKVIDKIRKLLALSNSPNENEATSAAEMAAALALRSGLDLAKIQGMDNAPGAERRIIYEGPFDLWTMNCYSAAARLNACYFYYTRYSTGNGRYYATGKPEKLEAAQLIGEYLVSAVTRLYKEEYENLKDRMGGRVDKPTRFNFRRTFKYACAQRVNNRSIAYVEELKKDDRVAEKVTGSTALVVAHHYETEIMEAKELLEKMGVKVRLVRSKTRGGLGTAAGRNAGDRVSLNPQIANPKRKMIR